MSWPIYVICGTVIFYFLIFLLVLFVNIKKSIGLGQFCRTPKELQNTVSKRIAPAPFYNKQRTFRFCYGGLYAFDVLLLITSVLFSAITAYLVLDHNVSSRDTVLCLAISLTATILRASLDLEKRARPYIQAVRILEFAILRFEYSDSDAAPQASGDGEPDPNNSPFQILLEANEAAENLIAREYE